MKKKKYLAELLCTMQFILLISCQSGSTNTIIVDDNLIAKGEFVDDSIYNGLVKFYDQGTNKLVYEGEYLKGLEHGIQRDFYGNGAVRNIRQYYYGKLKGRSILLDSLGQILYENNFFFDIPAGPLVIYKDGLPISYDFYSIDHQQLFHINYDSVASRKITELQEKFFFYNLYDKISLGYGHDKSSGIECRLYLLSPPKYQFRYELVLADDKFKVANTLKQFKNTDIQDVFTLIPIKDTTSNLYYAIKLTITDSINNNLENVMFKFLPTPY